MSAGSQFGSSSNKVYRVGPDVEAGLDDGCEVANGTTCLCRRGRRRREIDGIGGMRGRALQAAAACAQQAAGATGQQPAAQGSIPNNVLRQPLLAVHASAGEAQAHATHAARALLRCFGSASFQCVALVLATVLRCSSVAALRAATAGQRVQKLSMATSAV